MRLKYWAISLVAILFPLVFSGVTQGHISHVFEKAVFRNSNSSISSAQPTNSNHVIKFGYIKDAQPVSYTTQFGVDGYCASLKKFLEKTYNFQESDVTIPYEHRFERYEGISIECGANTISKKRNKKLEAYQGVFSDPFFTTSAKLLIRNDSRSQLSKATSSLRIGVIGKTTTQQVANSIYPNAELVSVIDRADAIKKLESNPQNTDSIDAYITDEILLPSMLDELPKNHYSIEPKAYGFSYESYGIVVYDNPVLLNTINQWIKSEEGQKAKKNELERKANYNWTSGLLKFLLSQDYFYNTVNFLLIFPPLIFLLLLFTNPLFISLIAKLPLFTISLNWMRRREQQRRKNLIDPLIEKILHNETFNVITYSANKSLVPMFIDRETVVTLIKEIAQPLISLDNEDEPSTIEIEVEKVAQNLAQKAESDLHFTKVLETVKDAASEETEKWIRNAVTRAFEILKQTVDPESSSS